MTLYLTNELGQQVVVNPGDVYQRQGDVLVEYIGPDDNEVPENFEVVGVEKLVPAVGEFLGHEHALYAVADGFSETDVLSVTKPDPNMLDERLEWLRHATQDRPGYLEHFISNAVEDDEKLIVRTGRNGLVLYHDDPKNTAIDEHRHAPLYFGPGILVGLFRQQQTIVDQRTAVWD